MEVQGPWGCSTGQGRAGQASETQRSEEPATRSGLALQLPSGPSEEKMLVSATASILAPVSTRSWKLSLFARQTLN